MDDFIVQYSTHFFFKLLSFIASCIFAIEQDTIKDPESEFRRMIDQVIHTTTRQV